MSEIRYYGMILFSGGNTEYNRVTTEMDFSEAADWWTYVTQYFRTEKNYSNISWRAVEISVFEILNTEESREITSVAIHAQ